MKMLSDHYREKFGCKVYKLSLDGGFTCPNRDGTCGTKGCIFCAGDGSGAFAEKDCGDIRQQLEQQSGGWRPRIKTESILPISSLLRVPTPRRIICAGSIPRPWLRRRS